MNTVQCTLLGTLLTVLPTLCPTSARAVEDCPPDGPAVAPPPREVADNPTRNWHLFDSEQEVEIGGGSNYLANQKLKIYIVPARQLFGDFVPNATLLTREYYRATVTTDAEGHLPRAKLGKCKAGLYYIIVDYSEDGEFTTVLDGRGILLVTEAR